MSRLIHPVRAQMTELSFKLGIYPLFFDGFFFVVVMQTHTHIHTRRQQTTVMYYNGRSWRPRREACLGNWPHTGTRLPIQFLALAQGEFFVTKLFQPPPPIELQDVSGQLGAICDCLEMNQGSLSQ